MTPKVDWALIAPETIVVAALVTVFVVDLLVSDKRRNLLTPLTLLALVASFASVIILGAGEFATSMISGSYVVDSFALVAKGFVIAATAVALLLGIGKTWKGEYLVLILSSLLGMMLVVSSRDIVLFFVAFELFAIPGYLLSGWRKRSRAGHEGLLKYYLLGVLATAVMLYGLSLLFGVAGGTSFAAVDAAMQSGGSEQALARIGLLFVLVGLAFKVSAVPFHFWAPDAYQGAPLPVAAFLSVVIKAAGMFSLLLICLKAFPSASHVWGPALALFAAVTMTAGNLAALRQRDLVRLLAYSSIAQAGYMMMPLAVALHFGGESIDAIRVTIEFLIIYAVSNLAAFGCVIVLARRYGSSAYESAYGAFAASPLLAVVFAISLFSLAGMPPFGGWFAKLVVFKAAIDAGSEVAIALVVVAAINTAIALFYYANIIRCLWLPPANPVGNELKTPIVICLALGLTTIAIVATGVAPAIVTNVGDWALFAQ